MDKDIVLRVEGLGKKFCRTLKRSLFYGTVDIARSMIGVDYRTDYLRPAEFWALDDISFELRRGETLGLIGQNGCGKTTLLRIINGIFPPDKGRIDIKGRIGALIAVGAGFHPHMTGRENIYLNGTILGMTRKEIDSKLEEIVDFAEIGEFINSPVATYSSGMTVRLGFAIAIHCDPQVMLVDEILSVGDLSFRNKCMRKMNEYRRNANGLVFVSHNLDQIRVLCNRVIFMDKGRVVFDGDTDEALIKYENHTKDTRVKSVNENINKTELFRIQHVDGERVVFNKLGLINQNGEVVNEVWVDEPLNILLDFSINEFCKEIYFTLGFVDEKNSTIFLWVKSNDVKKTSFTDVVKGRYRLEVLFPHHHLGVGVYYINYHILNGETGESYNHGFTNCAFSVKSNMHYERGLVLAEETWKLKKIF